MTEKTMYLITGANRGLGHALVSALLLREHHLVIASTRYPAIPTALEALPRHSTSSIVHVTASKDTRPFGLGNEEISGTKLEDVIASLSSQHPEINHIDVVIANAGTTGTRQSILETSSENLFESLQVNAVAPLRLLQATWPLLQVAKVPKFVYIGSIVGSITGIAETGGWSNAAYGASKAAGSYLVRKAGKELEGQLAVIVIHPGETGNERAVAQGLEKAPVTLAASVKGILEEIADIFPGKDAGFRTFDHGDIAW